MLSAKPVDLVILDIGLPDMDGLTITQQIRRHSNVAIIIVSGRGDLTDRVVGLEIGADDYVTKPFEPREILARVRSVLRRSHHKDHAVAARPSAIGDMLSGTWCWMLPPSRWTDARGELINLTSGEFRLLETMVTRANRVLSRDQLMDACYGNNTPAFDRSIDVCVATVAQEAAGRSAQSQPSFARCAMAAMSSPPKWRGPDPPII